MKKFLGITLIAALLIGGIGFGINKANVGGLKETAYDPGGGGLSIMKVQDPGGGGL